MFYLNLTFDSQFLLIWWHFSFEEDEWKMSVYSIMILEEFELWNGEPWKIN